MPIWILNYDREKHFYLSTFLSLNIQILVYFLRKNGNPPWNWSPLSFLATPLKKSRSCQAPALWKFIGDSSPLPTEREVQAMWGFPVLTFLISFYTEASWYAHVFESLSLKSCRPCSCSTCHYSFLLFILGKFILI